MNHEDIIKTFFSQQDTKYADFQKKLIPTVSPETVIGVRTPALRSLAKEIAKDKTDEGRTEIEAFLSDLPHKYFEENQLHAFIISLEKDYDSCIAHVEEFLPYVDNWATCDQMSPKIFKKNTDRLLKHIKAWITSEHTYTVRFSIGMLMEFYLNEEYNIIYPEMISKVRSDEYYVNMMIAWYYATALAKQYESIIPYIEGKKLDTWTHNKTIQKAVESYRITDEQKSYLKTLKIR